MEIFLKEKALEFDKRNKSRTYLLIDGCVILDCAISDIYRVQKIVGSRIAFLECADNVKVVNFYESNGFAFLQKSDDGEYLQMIRYL
ncbi:MAG: hypothetical protein LBI36_05340 [Oscillospiraceae bacterium]|nr:hypothetical protein [Oscillospiraceae bacterium]